MFSRSIITLLVLAAVSIDATRVMQRPDSYQRKPNKLPTTKNAVVHKVHSRASVGKAQLAYFTNWGIYGANFQPTDIVGSDLTTILYSFADISADTGAAVLTDSWADEQKHYPGDSWSESGNNLYGCLKQLYLLKMKQRNLKVVLSVGGWTYSQSGHFGFVTDAGKRATFVSSVVQLIKDYGFDGIDLDFEFPSNQAQGQGFADLITALRSAFTALMQSNGDSTPYLLSAAVSSGSDNYSYLKVAQMDAALDYWNLMAYDYAGSWSTFTDNQANLYGPSLSGYGTDAAIARYVGQGASASKINVGVPMYGRAFENTKGIGSPFNGIGPGSIEAGVYSYKDLPLQGAVVYENSTDVTSYSYDAAKQEFVSYDTPNIVKMKAQYVIQQGLAGSMFWELSTDKVGADSLAGASHSVYGELDQTPNHIHFPTSKWDNLRNNFGLSSVSNPAPITATSPVSSSKLTASTSTTSSTTSTAITTFTSTSASSTPTSSSTIIASTTPSLVSSTTKAKTTALATTTPVKSSTQKITTSKTTSTKTTSTKTTSTKTTSTKASKTAAPTSGRFCAGVAAWTSTAVYWGGQSAVYGTHLWTAKWWSSADTPGGAAGVWNDMGAC